VTAAPSPLPESSEQGEGAGAKRLRGRHCSRVSLDSGSNKNAIDAKIAKSATFCKVIMASIDEDLHSRQIWTYGLEAMRRMASTSVAVVGLNGLGAEVAKNLILANIQRVLLLDDCTTTLSDLSSHFYLSQLDIGLNRAHACRERLQQLNPAVSVTSHDVDYSSLAALLATCTAVVLCDVPLVEAEKLNAFCRERSPPVRFIMAQTCGLCFRVFSDFGNQFTYTSVDTPYSVRPHPLPEIKMCNCMYV
jgi:molybdopterin/thiamine biosynthesis adenylyltransferase